MRFNIVQRTHCCDREYIVDGFTTTCTISAFHHWSCELVALCSQYNILIVYIKRRVGRRYRQDGNITKKKKNYKMVNAAWLNGLVPPYLSAIVPCNFENIHDYNTRQAVCIPPVRTGTRTTLYNNYFLPSTVRLWNSEPTSIRDSRSPSSLNSYYKSKCIKKPIYYYSGTRIGQILHMRLRTACSSLNHHLFLKNVWWNYWTSILWLSCDTNFSQSQNN